MKTEMDIGSFFLYIPIMECVEKKYNFTALNQIFFYFHSSVWLDVFQPCTKHIENKLKEYQFNDVVGRVS